MRRTRMGMVDRVNVAPVERFEAGSRELTSAIRKVPQPGAVRLERLGLVGDEVFDRQHHGGANRAIHAFSSEHYEAFAPELPCAPSPPWMGENLTIRGYVDAVARVGDVLRVGTARLRVTMPTERCGHPGLVAGVPRLRKMMIDSLRTGFYCAVLSPGSIAAGDALEVEEAGDPQWTIAELSRVMYQRVADADVVAAVMRIPLLAPEWKERITVLHGRTRG